MSDHRQFAPATQRNREPILEVLHQVLPPTGTVLEISSGTGEHAVFFAPQLVSHHWLPSDPNPEARESICAWQDYAPCANCYPPIDLDASAASWLLENDAALCAEITAIVNINMIHIAPWSACEGLMAGASRVLSPGGILYLYGPFKQNGQHSSPSNDDFDRSLQLRDPAWGVRDLEAVVAIAHNYGLSLLQTYPMPANNLSVVFQVR